MMTSDETIRVLSVVEVEVKVTREKAKDDR